MDMLSGARYRDAVGILMSEANEVKRTGGRLQPNSGRGKHNKGDAQVGPFVYDIKEYAKGFTVSRSVWAKASTDAITVGIEKEPALQLVLGSPPLRLWVVSDDMFMEMLDAWTNEQLRKLD